MAFVDANNNALRHPEEAYYENLLQAAIDWVFDDLYSSAVCHPFAEVGKIMPSTNSYLQYTWDQTLDESKLLPMFSHENLSSGKPTQAVEKATFPEERLVTADRLAIFEPFNEQFQVERPIIVPCAVRGYVFHRVMPKSQVLLEFMKYFLRTSFVAAHVVTGVRTMGVSFSHERWKTLRVPLPPIAVQRQIADYLRRIEALATKPNDTARPLLAKEFSNLGWAE